MLSDEGVIKYTKFLILAHMFRNELMIAPQITELGQRFSTSEQMRGFTEGYVRQQGSRAKYGELYQWAVMMPHVQGILVYLILIGYPFAAMLMVIPGYWKAFFTWVSFFAWVKLWDVGFAIVHTLERSVWAMIGNNSAMARVGRRLINTANNGNGDILVTCGGGATGGAGGGTSASQKLSELCSVPTVKEANALGEDDAWFLLDQILTVAGSLDLDLSNGYYIYIMAALYFAVPAVTGQLVLGAKAGLGGLATQGLSQSAGEAGGAAKTGTVGENATRMGANSAAIDQGAKFKSFRQSGFAQQSLDAQNAAMDADIRGAEIGGAQKYADTVGSVRGLSAESQGASFSAYRAVLSGDSNASQYAGRFVRTRMSAQPAMSGGGIGQQPGADADAVEAPKEPPSAEPQSGSGLSPSEMVGGGMVGLLALAGGGKALTKIAPFLGRASRSKPANYGRLGLEAGIMVGASANALHNAQLQKSAIGAKGQAAGLGLDLGWDSNANNLYKAGHQMFGQQRLTPAMQFNAAEDSWAAKNSYGANAGMHAVMGASPGSTGAGGKSDDSMGAIMSGQVGAGARKAALYAGSDYFLNAGNAMARGKNRMGGAQLLAPKNGHWQHNSISHDMGAMVGRGLHTLKDVYQGNLGEVMDLSGFREGFEEGQGKNSTRSGNDEQIYKQIEADLASNKP
jgi:hypothetical protein